jgi:DNA-binding NarL/FixJ family response regulator
MPLRILVADDHDVVRKGLRAILQARRGWRVCAEAANGREAVEKAKRLKPDVAVLDISMPSLNGVEATRQIRKVSPRTEVLILTMHESETLLRQVVEAGAWGYVLKADPDRNVLAALEALSRHEPFFSLRFTAMVSDDLLRRSPPSGKRQRSPHHLSPREREIVQLLAEAKNNKEIAAILGISVKTVETHRARIMLKLDLHSVVELARYAIRNKIVQG